METAIDIKVMPKSSRNKITVSDTEGIKVYITSPPVDGKANEQCIKLLAKKAGIAKSSISIIKGEKGRQKRLLIRGLSMSEITEALSR